MSAPARSDGSAGSAVSSASAPRTSFGVSAGAVESAASSGSAVPPLPFSSVSSSASAPPALMPASSAGPSVTVEDESTKRCSACAKDRPVSAFSSAQLKKKGKRVCSGCVSKKDAAAATQQQAATASARKESMKSAFATKLNSAPTQAASPCWCCGSKAAVRSVPCVRCSVECCSLKCFDGHDCDAYLEARRTMPTDLIPEEDRFDSPEEILASWKELFCYLRTLPVSGSAVHLESLRSLNRTAAPFAESLRSWIAFVYSPRVCTPWWNPGIDAVGSNQRMRHFILVLATRALRIGRVCSILLDSCTIDMPMPTLDEILRGWCYATWTTHRSSACFLPGRLLHKLLTLLRFVVRTMGSEWTQAHFDQPGDVSNEVFGILPGAVPDERGPHRLGYLELPAPNSGLRTLVPLYGAWQTARRFCILSQHLGQRALSMVLRDGKLVLDRGLCLTTTAKHMELNAVTGWTGKAMDSFAVAPTKSVYWSDTWLLRDVKDPAFAAFIGQGVKEEIEARKRPNYFHLIPAIKQLIPEDKWPRAPGSLLFIATPQRGIESELVELSLLESLVEDAAAGNEQAQLLLTHIESECAAPIAEVIARQKSRLDQMLEDQAAQLRIHADAVKRAELRGRIKGPSTAAVDGAVGPAASASVSSSSIDAALARTSAASSSSSAVSAVRVSSLLDGPAFSWTQSREYKGLESLREPGRKKYSTIMAAAKKFLYSISHSRVNKKGGSHLVFHFPKGPPLALVQLHTGSRSKDSTAHTTRLYAQFCEVAAQQGMAGASAIEGATEAERDAAGRRLLH